MPHLEIVAETFKNEPVHVARINADIEEALHLKEKYEIKTYPTLLMFPKNGGKPEAWRGPRRDADIIRVPLTLL